MCCCCYADFRCVELVTRLLDCSFTQSDTDMLFDDFKAMNKSTLVGACFVPLLCVFAAYQSTLCSFNHPINLSAHDR